MCTFLTCKYILSLIAIIIHHIAIGGRGRPEEQRAYPGGAPHWVDLPTAGPGSSPHHFKSVASAIVGVGSLAHCISTCLRYKQGNIYTRISFLLGAGAGGWLKGYLPGGFPPGRPWQPPPPVSAPTFPIYFFPFLPKIRICK